MQVALAVILLAALPLFANQQQSTPLYQPQAPNAAQDVPNGSAPGPESPIPPDTKAPPPIKLTDRQAADQIQSKLATEPALRNEHLKVVVDGNRVVLTGHVADQDHRAVALRIVESYSGERKIVDKVVVP